MGRVIRTKSRMRRSVRAYVDGKPRYDGVAAFLAARSIELPAGTPEDGPGMHTVAYEGYRGDSLDLRITHHTLTVRSCDRGAAPIQLAVRGETCELAGAGTRAFRLGSVA